MLILCCIQVGLLFCSIGKIHTLIFADGVKFDPAILLGSELLFSYYCILSRFFFLIDFLNGRLNIQ